MALGFYGIKVKSENFLEPLSIKHYINQALYLQTALFLQVT